MTEYQPRIGITTGYRDGVQAVDHNYVRAVEAAGGLPLLVPMLEQADHMTAFARLLDGLVITGGPGITQGLLGDLPPDLPPAPTMRTDADRLIYEAMADRPVLGICYGMQFINAQAGGTIYADLVVQRPGSLLHSRDRGGTDHALAIQPDSRLASILSTETLTVNSHHIQAVAALGQGLRAVAFGPDGVIEAIESEDGRQIGVQFHPERMLDRALPLFAEFVARCRQGTREG